jgi:hypothetical protein
VVNFRLSLVWPDRAIFSIALLAVTNVKDRQLRPKSLRLSMRNGHGWRSSSDRTRCGRRVTEGLT